MEEYRICESIRKSRIQKENCLSELQSSLREVNNRINTIIAALIAVIVAIVVSVSSNSFVASEMVIAILVSCIIVPFVYFCFDLHVLRVVEKLIGQRANNMISNDYVIQRFQKMMKFSKFVGKVKYTFVSLVSIATICYLISLTLSRYY